MKSLSLKIVVLFLVGVFFYSCNDDDNGNLSVSETLNENDFVWKAMNLWYFYQDEIPDLANDRFTSDQEYTNYLNTFSSPDQLFDSLEKSDDRFSAIFPDLNVLLNSFQGVSTSFGYEFGLYFRPDNPSEVVGVVFYVVPGSPADNAGIERGNLFTTINGTTINENNFNTLLNNTTYTLGFADWDSTDETLTLNGEQTTMTAIEFTENPVLLSTVIEQDGVRIGYLVYNSFVRSFDDELNTAIGDLAAQGITELVLDLRYNGGGSVTSAQYLCSMITGDFTGQELVSLRYSENINALWERDLNEPRDQVFDFVSQTTENSSNGAFTLNTLGLDHLYVLTTNDSASASELVINSLRPYITVTTIGTATNGKNVGQVALFDSPTSAFTNPNTATNEHTWAMLPICFSYFNAQGSNDFANGIPADEMVDEEVRANLFALRQLGDTQEPLLARAISVILGNGETLQGSSTLNNTTGSGLESETSVFRSKSKKLFSESMYLNEHIELNP